MASRLPPQVADNLALPAIVAPMFLVSGPELVLASCAEGLCGSFPAPNCRTLGELEEWLDRVSSGVTRMRNRACSRKIAPWALNMVVHRTYERLDAELELLARYRPPIVITALGSPAHVIDAVHAYGGLVFADVNSVRFARKAAAAGVDGLILVSAGAGGHVGPLAGFAFLPEVRRFWDGPLVLAGAICDGRAVRAAEVLGADLAYLGTRFIAARESMAVDGYKDMLIDAGAEDVALTNAVTGVPANFLSRSLAAAGFDPRGGIVERTVNFAGDPHDEAKAWKNIWSAGQGVGATGAVEPVAEIADALKSEYAAAVAEGLEPNRWLKEIPAAAAE